MGHKVVTLGPLPTDRLNKRAERESSSKWGARSVPHTKVKSRAEKLAPKGYAADPTNNN